MRVAVDIGNSGLKIACLDTLGSEQSELAVERINWQLPAPRFDQTLQPTTNKRFLPSSSDWLPTLESLCERWQLDGDTTWLLSTVRGDASSILAKWLESTNRGRLRIVTFQDIPLGCNVNDPSKVGIDRLLAAFAASRLASVRPLVVIQAGSAVTVDLLRSDHQQDTFCGGAILPGVPMMLRLLGQGAEKLPTIDSADLSDLPTLPGRDTQSAMLCGAASALVGGISHLTDRYRREFGETTQVIVSGGDGPMLSSHIAAPVSVHQQLVLAGLSYLED